MLYSRIRSAVSGLHANRSDPARRTLFVFIAVMGEKRSVRDRDGVVLAEVGRLQGLESRSAPGASSRG